MRIAIDGRTVGMRTGMGTYSSSLIKSLTQLGNEAEYFAYATRMAQVQTDNDLCQRIAWGSLENHTIGDFWEHIVLPFELKNSSIDVYHGTNARLPVLKFRTRYVLTIHDLIPWILPHVYASRFGFYISKVTAISARRADLIIVPSNCTKKDVVRLLGISPEKIRVVYEGVSDRFRVLDKKECLNRVQKEYNVRGRFLLFVGRLERKKNVPGLLRSLRLLIDQEDFDLQLVLVGGKTWIHEELVESIHRNRLEDRVVFVHGAGNDELKFLYNAASVFVLPSFYEGFGLPLLEAMACGTPVVASNISSIPEIAGNAAVLVDPSDPQNIADGIKVALFDSGRRQKLIKNGLARVRGFSWKATAAKTFETYEESVHKKRIRA